MKATYAEGERVAIKDQQGLWQVVGRIPYSGDRDPAYDVVNVLDGRRRVFRASRLRRFS